MLKKINKLTLTKLNKKLNRISTGILLVIFILFAFIIWWFRKPVAVQNVTQIPKPEQKESSRENNLDINATGVIKVENGILTGPANTDDLPEGTQNLYFKRSRVTPIVWNIVSMLTTDNIAEGDHLYYTDSRVYNALSAQSPIVFDSNTGVISLKHSGITQAYIAHNNVYPVHLHSINAPADGWLLQYDAINNSFEWVSPSSFNSETITTITNTVSGHKIADYTNEEGMVTPINETITSLSLSGNTLIFTDESGTVNTINLPVYHSIWDTDVDTGIDLEATSDEDYIRFYTYGNQRSAIDNHGNVIFSTYNPSDFINPGTFSGILFNAGKNALRIGLADGHEWDDSNVGLGTLASGRNNIVSGNYSVALGGNNNINDVYSAALGRYLSVSSSYSFAGGYQNTASGYASAVLGQQNTVSGRRAFVWGMKSQATADESTAFGYNTQATGIRSLAFGNNTVASGAYSVAFGSDTLASGTYATAFGRSTIANNTYATAWGNDTEATGYGSTSFGYRAKASGQYSLAAGYYSEASGNDAVALNDTVANSYMMTAVGRFNVVDNSQSPNTWVDTDYLFVVGNGTGYQAADRHNALSIYKNGRLEINAPVDQALLSNHPTGHVPLALATVGYVNSHVGTSIFDADADTGIQVEAHPDEDYIRMQTAGTERFVIDNNGHVGIGIGTNSLVSILQVGPGTSEPSTFAVAASPDYLNIATFRDQDGENIFRAMGSLANNDLIVTFGDWDWAYDHFSFGLDKSQDSFDFFNGELRLHEWVADQEDYVGFKAPSDVASNTIWTLPGSDGGNGYLLQTDGAGNLSWVNPATLDTNIYKSDGTLTGLRTVNLGGNNLIFAGSGNIGIGTGSPVNKLQVVGNVRATRFVAAGGTASSPAFRFSTDSNTGMYLPANDTLAFTTNGIERYRINQDGLLTYGTTVTDYDLAYFGTQHSVVMVNQDSNSMAAYGGIHYGNDINPSRIAMLKARGMAGTESAVQSGDEIAEFASAGYDGSQYMTTGGLKVVVDGAVSANNLPSRLDFLVNKGSGNLGADVVMSLNHNGNLGIGTQTPNYKLDVQGSANIAQDIHLHARLFDSSDSQGLTGQVLTVGAGGSIVWKNPVSCVIGGAKIQADGTVINSYGNIASVTHSNTGRYRINFSNSLNTNDYYVHLTKMESTSTRDDVNIDVAAYNTDYVDVIIHEGDNGSAANIYRDRDFAITIFDANCKALSEAGSPSDIRLKTNIRTIDNPLGLIEKLRGVRYQWNTQKYPNRKDFDNKPEIGLIAQEVKEVVPEVVELGDDGYYRIEYGKLTALLTEGIKSQQKEIADLQRRTTVNSRFSTLVSKVLGLENQLQSLKTQQENSTHAHNTPSPTPTNTPSITPTSTPTPIIANTDNQDTSDNTQGTTEINTPAPLSKFIDNVWNIVSEVIFKYKATFEKLVTFMADVHFNKRVQFADKDMAGYAVIKAGDTRVHIEFETSYKQIPVVNVTPVGTSVSYYIDNITKSGFDIIVSNTYNKDIKFSWVAINIKQYKVTYSHEPNLTPTATQMPTVSPTPTSSPSITPTSVPTVVPTNTPTNTPTPTTTPIPSSSPTPTVTPTSTPTPSLTPSATPSQTPAP